jgi:predicted GNAT family N-acyltransferase
MGAISDEHEAHSRHWAAFSPEGNLVAAARLCIHEKQQDVPEGYCYSDLDLQSPVASLNRLVVEKSARNRGIAQKLDLHRIKAAQNAGAACIVAAPTSGMRIQALEKVGFLVTSSRCKCSYKTDFWLAVMILDLRGMA